MASLLSHASHGSLAHLSTETVVAPAADVTLWLLSAVGIVIPLAVLLAYGVWRGCLSVQLRGGYQHPPVEACGYPMAYNSCTTERRQ